MTAQWPNIHGYIRSSRCDRHFTLSLLLIAIAVVMGKRKEVVSRPRKIKYPCAVCDKSAGVATILCTGCGLWTHRQCTLLSPEEFRDYSTSDDYFICRRCTDDDVTPGSFSYVRSLQRLARSLIILTSNVA